MIRAAERIGAEKGLAAMSLRAVQEAAGQRNKSAAQYHFGSRRNLVVAVVNARMGPIQERRLQLLADLNGEASLRDLVEILVVPVVEAVLTATPSYWARFVMQGMVDPTLVDVTSDNVEGAAFRLLLSQMRSHLDHLPSGLAKRRLDHVVALVFADLAVVERAHANGSKLENSVELITADLVDVGVAVLTAQTTVIADPRVQRSSAPSDTYANVGESDA